MLVKWVCSVEHATCSPLREWQLFNFEFYNVLLNIQRFHRSTIRALNPIKNGRVQVVNSDFVIYFNGLNAPGGIAEKLQRQRWLSGCEAVRLVQRGVALCALQFMMDLHSGTPEICVLQLDAQHASWIAISRRHTWQRRVRRCNADPQG